MRYPPNYFINFEPPLAHTMVGGCPYGTVPPDYDFYQYSGKRQLARRFSLTVLTFAAKASYADGDLLNLYLLRAGESGYGAFYQSAGVRAKLLEFEFDTNGSVGAGKIALNIAAATTAADVAGVFRAAYATAGQPIMKADLGLVAGTVELVGKRPQHGVAGISGTGVAAGKTTVSHVRTLTVSSPPLIALGGRGAILAPQYRGNTIVGNKLREGRLEFGNWI